MDSKNRIIALFRSSMFSIRYNHRYGIPQTTEDVTKFIEKQENTLVGIIKRLKANNKNRYVRNKLRKALEYFYRNNLEQGFAKYGGRRLREILEDEYKKIQKK